MTFLAELIILFEFEAFVNFVNFLNFWKVVPTWFLRAWKFWNVDNAGLIDFQEVVNFENVGNSEKVGKPSRID